MCNMELFFQPIRNLSTVSKERYEQKVISTGLKRDFYVIKDQCENPVSPPDIPQCSDLVFHMTTIPSQFTCEAVMVRNCIFQYFDAN